MPATLAHDRRLMLARPDLASAELEGLVAAARYVEPELLVCTRSAMPLRAHPDAGAEQMNQILFGEVFAVIEENNGWAFGQTQRDRYVGYVETKALGAPVGLPSHWVASLRTYAYADANVKVAINALLTMNSPVVVEAVEGKFSKVAGAGWVFTGHLREIGDYRDDPVAVALEFLGAPYQWGGRESLGLDCSGLVQAALHACGLSCPRDSDLQEAQLGADVGEGPLMRGDLMFWTGHVGMMVDETSMVHSNGHHMGVVVEALAPTIERIAAAGAGQPTGRRRIVRP